MNNLSLNTISINLTNFDPSKQKPEMNHVALEEKAHLPTRNTKAGQRRLKNETVCFPKLAIGAAHPSASDQAEDLQAVYEKYKNLGGWKMTEYIAHIGDIQSMSVLIKYGLDVNKLLHPNAYSLIQRAMQNAKYKMVQFLADSGALLPPSQWYFYMSETKYLNNRIFLKDTTEEKLKALEYLLDHGTNAKSIIEAHHIIDKGLLYHAFLLNPQNAAEQHYKDGIIKMLLDRGAKLN